MSGLRLRVVIVWAVVCARGVALVQIYNTPDVLPLGSLVSTGAILNYDFSWLET